jgi:hypothetical protein
VVVACRTDCLEFEQNVWVVSAVSTWEMSAGDCGVAQGCTHVYQQVELHVAAFYFPVLSHARTNAESEGSMAQMKVPGACYSTYWRYFASLSCLLNVCPLCPPLLLLFLQLHHPNIVRAYQCSVWNPAEQQRALQVRHRREQPG